MIGKMWAAAAALGALMMAMPAAAQSGKWRVIVSTPDIMMFATTATGPETARDLNVFVMLPQVYDGIDNSISHWTVDCKAATALDHGGDGYLGSTRTGPFESMTQDEPKSTDDQGLLKTISDYACKGSRLASDATTFKDDDAARAYAKSKFKP